MANTEGNKLAAALGPTEHCLPLDELAHVMEGRRGAEARRDSEAHMQGCAYCQSEIALLREFESAAIRPDERSAVNEIAARLRKNSPAAAESWWQRISSAKFLVPAVGFAVALIVVTVGVQFRHGAIQSYVPSASDVMRGQSVEIIAPVGDVAQPPEQLEWRPVAEAREYKISLMEVDRTELWSATVQQTSVRLPLNIRAKLSPLKTIQWQVSAVDRGGVIIGESGVQRFRVNQQ